MAPRARTEVAVGPEERFVAGRFVMLDIPGQDIGVVRLRDGQLRAVRNYCPHKGAPICRGIVGGTWLPSQPGTLHYDREGGVLACPWHGWEYDLDTGMELFRAVPTRLRFYPVTVRDGQVYVTVRAEIPAGQQADLP
jgi:nitrite reductase/ring-hydroxylating ferredoxin subunit